MNPGQVPYDLRERRWSRRLRLNAPSQGLNSEVSQTDRSRPSYLEPWIETLLLKYNESEASPEGQFGQVLKVLNEASAPHQDGQDPAAVVYIADGHHYIQAVVPASAIQAAKGFPQQPEFSSILGQFIVLQNFRVCLKEATRVEDSGFYLVLDSFRVTSMKRQEMRQQDCNQAPSVLQRIKELWLRGLALKPLPSSEPSSVSEVLREMKQDKLSRLKQDVEDCLSSLDPSSLLDSEQLAVYPDTKWQVERKHDKIQHRDIFTVPAKLLMIGAEDMAALSRSYSPKTSHVASDNEISTDDDHSTVSFVSAEAETLDGSLENPWDLFPGMSLTSSKDTQPSLPNAQQMFLASPAEEEEAADSCTPDILQSCDPISHSSSAQVEPVEMTSPSLLLPYKEGASQESRSKALNTVHHTSKISDIDDSIPCSQPLNKADSHSVHCLSPVCSTTGNTFPPKPLSGHVEENHPVHLPKKTVGGSGVGAESLETSRKCGAAKRKQLMPDGEESTEASFRQFHISQKAQDLTSATVFRKSSRLEKRQVTQKLPLKFVRESTPKKSRREEIHVQQLQTSARSRCDVRHQGKQKEQTVTTGGPADACWRQLGVEQQDHVRRAPYHHTYPPPTAEQCSQVQTTRISRALLGWARWVLRNEQK